MTSKDIVSMEYEANAMISEKEYQIIKDDNLSSDFKYRELTNSNSYFDTKDCYLVNHHMVLRVRTINDNYREITLKAELEDGIKEINYEFKDKLDKNSSFDFKGKYPEIYNVLISKEIDPNKIRYITTLVTERIEVFKKGYLFVIDKNTYSDIIDYNLEVESDSKKNAQKYLNKELAKYHIKNKKNYVGKSRRAILTILNKN